MGSKCKACDDGIHMETLNVCGMGLGTYHILTIDCKKTYRGSGLIYTEEGYYIAGCPCFNEYQWVKSEQVRPLQRKD